MKATTKEVITIYKETGSIRKTGILTGWSKSSVQTMVSTAGISLSKSRTGADNSSRKALIKLANDDPRRLVRDRVYMVGLYIHKKMSIPDIAKLLKISNSTVLTGLNQCGISRRSLSTSLKGKALPHQQGSKHRCWKGGITGWRKLARNRLNDHFVRPIMERDGFKCVWCSSVKNLVVHHHMRSFMEIVNIVRGMVDDSDIEAFVNAIVAEHKLDDGITLCKKCHDNHHKENGY